jgi:hypothetical protein
MFIVLAKSFDLAIEKEKLITKCKSFGYGSAGKDIAHLLPSLP